MNFIVGQNFSMNYQAASSNPSLFVRAYVFDENSLEIAGSPFTLTHVARGLYVNNSVVAPDTEFLIIQYEVAEDAGFTQLAVNDGYGIDALQKDTAFETLDQKADLILSRVSSLFAPSASLAVTMEQDEMVVSLRQNEPIITEISDDEIEVILVQDGQIVTEVNPNTLIIKV